MNKNFYQQFVNTVIVNVKELKLNFHLLLILLIIFNKQKFLTFNITKRYGCQVW